MIDTRKNLPKIDTKIMKLKAFTLVELLVVIAVMTLLLAILMPVLQAARENARRVVCGSNVKQLLLAMTAYETQNVTFPYGCNTDTFKGTPPGGWLPYSNSDKQGWWWFHFLSNYIGDNFDKKSVIWCPSRHINADTKSNVRCGNYGVNHVICKDFKGNTAKTPNVVGTPLRVSQIPHPAQTFLLGDCGYSLISWWHAAASNAMPSPYPIAGNVADDTAYIPGLWVRSGSPRIGTEFDAFNGRHPKKTVNAGFVDGHISCLKATDFYVEKVDDEYKNRSPLWLP